MKCLSPRRPPSLQAPWRALPRPPSSPLGPSCRRALPPAPPTVCPSWRCALSACRGADSCCLWVSSFGLLTHPPVRPCVQRVMTWPGSVRFHYGHPDLWNKLFIMTRGGVSKATRCAGLECAGHGQGPLAAMGSRHCCCVHSKTCRASPSPGMSGGPAARPPALALQRLPHQRGRVCWVQPHPAQRQGQV